VSPSRSERWSGADALPGMTLQDVKEQLGHSSIVLTSNTYGHVVDAGRTEMARELEAVLGG
jgi:integrase